MIPKFFPWTDEQIERLAALTAEGKTISEIAEIFGLTRGAVSGKRDRLGIQAPPKPRPERTAKPRVRKPKPKPAKPKAPAPIVKPTITLPNLGLTPMSPALFCADPDALDHPILALDHDSCRWPVGDPRDDGFRYCAASKRGPGPYCSVHSGVAFVPRALRKTVVRKLDEAAW